jgi:DNA-binding MarR family transcriptional regulator
MYDGGVLPSPPSDEDALVDDADLARRLVGVLSCVANRGLPSHVLAVVLVIKDRPGITVRFLRDALGIPQATASTWLKEAVEEGVVEVRASEHDKRATLARLTAKGARYFADVRRARAPSTHARPTRTR